MKVSLRLRDIRHLVLGSVLMVAVVSVGMGSQSLFAATGPCSAPATDYGTVSNSVNVTGSGTYRIWTRMSAPDTTNNTYLLEIDGSSCYTIGGSGVPTYANGAVTFFSSGSTNWVSKTTTGAQVDVNLSAGAHTIKLIGNAAGVVVDRLVLTQDLTCVPTGTGDNCANPPDTTPPTVSITSPANGASLATTTTVTASATDDVAVSKVEFYVDGTLKATDTSAPYTYSLNPTGLSGSHSMYAVAYDTANNATTSATVNFTVDSTPPTISAVQATGLTQNSATVTWTTDEAADSQVKYGTTVAYGSTTTLDATKVTTHSVTLSGLSAGTLYHYQVVSKDANGNTATSADATFTTGGTSTDTTKPVVSLTAPANGSTVAGKSVALSATATDNIGVVSVQFQAGGSNIGAVVTTPSGTTYTTAWDTTTLANGSYVVTAVARDAAGNATTSTSFTLIVNNRAADINQDGVVNYLDLSIVASNYGKSGAAILNRRADINGSGTVDYLDLSVLASNYGK
jgi:hypothetical protein